MMVADRGDATQLDPAVIEAMNAVVNEAMDSDAFCGPWCNSERNAHIRVAWLIRQLVPPLAEAAAGVIIHATAEHIAEAILARIDKFPKDWVTYEDAAKVAHDFAADLSADAVTTHTRYEPCVIGADGRCTRVSHDHSDADAATTGGDSG